MQKQGGGTPFPKIIRENIIRCHSYIKLNRDELPSKYETYQYCTNSSETKLPGRYALAYDYIPKGKVDLEVGQAQLDFFYQIGYGILQYLSEVKLAGMTDARYKGQ